MCTTCYDAPELSLEEIKGIIDQTAAWGVEVFNPLGGEPFMRADIEEILSYAVRRGFYVTVTTNGTLITEKRARAIAAIPSDRLHFNISLDGDEQANDEIRSSGMWSRAIEGFSRIRAADQAAGNARRKILANTILNARNAERFHAILDEQAELGFDGVQILNLFRQGNDVPKEAAGLWFHPEKLEALSELAESLAQRAEKQGVVGYRIQNTPENLRQIPRYYSEDLKPLEAPCWAGWKELYINSDGQAIMCDGELDFLKGGFGNVRENTLKELWASPKLMERRSVVKSCTTPCVQNCYQRETSDSASELVLDASKMIGRRIAGRLASMRSTRTTYPDAVLRLELSDVCPCDSPICNTPSHRWDGLIQSIPQPVQPAEWTRYRDRGLVDFGRGFMGFEVVRSVLADLRSSRFVFGELAIRWRGEPFLHPEIEPIVESMADAIVAGHVAERLLIETDGRFLSPRSVDLAQHKAPQTWVFDVDRGGWDAVMSAYAAVNSVRQQHVVLQIAVSATSDVDVDRVSSFGLPIYVGHRPPACDAVWVRRTDHDHFMANNEARSHLAAVATALGVDAELGMEDEPRFCTAPERSPTISWDGKVTLCPWDPGLENVVGDVVASTFSSAWVSGNISSDRRAVRERGVPDRCRCRDCAMPWSPNQD